MKLSNRLQAILNRIPAGSRMADIGSDHALLPSAAVQAGVCVSAIAGEVNQGPYEAAQRQVRQEGLAGSISVRKGDGLQVLEPGEADVITIAGMGGSLIAAILNNGMDKLEGVSRLVLQPNVGEDILRKWLLAHGWVLVDECILEEDGKIYEVLTAVPEEGSESSNGMLYQDYTLDCGILLSADWLLRFGPILIKQPTSVFAEKWSSELRKTEGVLAMVEQSQLPTAEVKAKELKDHIHMIKEVLSCLRKDKP
ncbi:tRNA (adenine(22)-N(1))-methyltransferase [Paenibacillus sp. JSM ZJ436]|uniref:tRNA (adenine(22)-N(1))-methyltransferase n=1 Tax=Paenibacillus sp. JSM ZJ436 TaxID=3376190 RepID=UPI00379128B7